VSTPLIRTDRLDLEPVSPAHADEMVELLADRRLYAFYDDEASPTIDELRLRYERQAAGRSADGLEVWHTWIVRERASESACGFVQATVRVDDTGRSVAELAWVIGSAHQGHGYAREAAAGVRDAVTGAGSVSGDDAEVVVAHIAPGHVASESVAAGIGLALTDMVHDGERRWQLPSVVGTPTPRT
jgi:RimJ/RimL family protein N-acetyltransferase